MDVNGDSLDIPYFKFLVNAHLFLGCISQRGRHQMPENATCFDLTPLSWQRRGSRNDQAPHQFHQFHHGLRCCVKHGSWYFTASTEKTSCALRWHRLGRRLADPACNTKHQPTVWSNSIHFISLVVSQYHPQISQRLGFYHLELVELIQPIGLCIIG